MENINLIRKIAWSFHHSTGLDWDDLFQEAALAYLEGLNSYDSSKGKLTTHMWHCMTSKVTDYLRQEGKINTLLDPIEDYDFPAPNSYQPTFFEELTKDAQEIAKIIINLSPVFLCLSSDQAEDKIKRILLEDGWSPRKIRIGLRDLKYVCAH